MSGAKWSNLFSSSSDEEEDHKVMQKPKPKNQDRKSATMSSPAVFCTGGIQVSATSSNADVVPTTSRKADNFGTRFDCFDDSDDSDSEPSSLGSQQRSTSNVSQLKSCVFEDNDNSDVEEKSSNKYKKPINPRKKLKTSTFFSGIGSPDRSNDGLSTSTCSKNEMLHLTEKTDPIAELESSPKILDWKKTVAATICDIAKAIESMPDMNKTETLVDFSALKTLNVKLYSHQQYGASWMIWRENQQPSGGILAYDMGLGKTIICIAVIVRGKEIKADDRTTWRDLIEIKKLFRTWGTLIICPVTCMMQWENEIRTKTKGLNVIIYHGSDRTKSVTLLADYDVVITSYQTVGAEIPKTNKPDQVVESPLLVMGWERLILDEGHVIRNPQTVNAQGICRLTAKNRWVVTGTPVHNRAQDIFSLVKFLQMEPFDDQQVWRLFIGMNFVPDSNKERLNLIAKAILLQRTKDEVQNAGGDLPIIPPKTVEVVQLELQEAEREVYDHLEEYAKQQFKYFLAEQEQRSVAKQGDSDEIKQRKGLVQNLPEYSFSHMLALLTRLRQCSVLPFLTHTMIEKDAQGSDTYNSKTADKPAFKPGYRSAKIRAVMKELLELKEEAKCKGVPMDKIIIVSQWTTLLEILRQHLEHNGYTYSSITGAQTVNERSATMSAVNSDTADPEVLLLSITAGGVGLNLVGANRVIFVEPHWNPMLERQAQDRVHRFGQRKPVFIKRFIAKDTIESRVLDLQAKKINLADGLMDGSKKGSGAGISVADMKTLFGL